MYVITGATGNTGKPITLALLAAGKKVRIISRDEEKAKELTEKGAELFLGDATNYEVLNKAFKGATAVYAMIPPNYSSKDFYAYQQKCADAIAKALKERKVKYVVSLSSVSTHLEENSGVIFGLRYMEQKFDAILGLNTLHLRPTYFMENTFRQITVIKQFGVMGSPMKGDLVISMIAIKDVVEHVIKRLLALNFSGHNIQYLLGQRDLTYKEVARIIGSAIGKPDLNYVEFPFDDFKKTLMDFGASQSLAESMSRFIQVTNEGKTMSDAKRNKDNTTKTSIEEFAMIFAHVFNSSK